jgi:hypothetical protein
MNTQELEEVFDGVLGPAGFRKRKHTWFKTNPDTITLVDLQKSQWGGQYYVNLAVFLRDLGDVPTPAEHRAHLRVRLTAVAGSECGSIEQALDLERPSLSAGDRRAVLTCALRKVAVSYLASRSTLSQLRELSAAGELGPVLMTKAARELLAAKPPA